MSELLDLIDLIEKQVAAAHYGSPTSERAARKASLKANSTSHRILHVLAAHGPKTPDEVARILGLQPGQVRPRFTTPLIDNGWIEDTGFQRTTTALEGEQYVCAITDAGRALIESPSNVVLGEAQ